MTASLLKYRLDRNIDWSNHHSWLLNWKYINTAISSSSDYFIKSARPPNHLGDIDV